MMPLLTPDEMRALEREAIDSWGIPALLLQEHAALGALRLIPKDAPIYVLVGPGQNGGDALALARLACLEGRKVEVWTLDPSTVWKGDAALQAKLWQGMGGTFCFTKKPEEATRSFRGWLVDGLFGLGGRPPLDGLAAAWAKAINACSEGGTRWEGAPFRVLALDLPSGLDPGTGEGSASTAIAATATACFGFRKRCHELLPARALCGDLHIIPLPFPRTPEARLWMAEPPRRQDWDYDIHKRQRGHVGIRAGQLGMSGAAVLAALGALRMGAGLVTLLVDEAIRAEVAAQVPEAMVRPWTGAVPDDLDVLLVGPGGVDQIPEWRGPLVLDASALRPGEGAAWLQRPATVLTPHAGEFSRSFQRSVPEGTTQRVQAIQDVAMGPGVIVLKGAQTLIAGGGEPSVIVNPTGHSGLATGGTGDFLAGMVATATAHWHRVSPNDPIALRAQVRDAVWLHGAAADRLGPGPLLVRELAESLSALLRERHRD